MPESSRSRVRAMFEERSDALTEFSLPDLTDEVVAAVKADAALLDQFLDEHLRPMVYEIGASFLSSQRASVHRVEGAMLAISATVLPETKPPKRVKGALFAPPRAGKGFAWLRAPLAVERGRHVRLARARTVELDRAIALREDQIRPTRQRTMHYRLLRDGLPDADRMVGDVFDEQRIAALWEEAGRRVAAEDRANSLAAQAIVARAAKRKPALAAPTAQ